MCVQGSSDLCSLCGLHRTSGHTQGHWLCFKERYPQNTVHVRTLKGGCWVLFRKGWQLCSQRGHLPRRLGEVTSCKRVPLSSPPKIKQLWVPLEYCESHVPWVSSEVFQGNPNVFTKRFPRDF